MLEAMGTVSTHSDFTLALRACANGNRADKVLELIDSMKELGVDLDETCYNIGIGALGRNGDGSRAFELYTEMTAAGLSSKRSRKVTLYALTNSGMANEAAERMLPPYPMSK